MRSKVFAPRGPCKHAERRNRKFKLRHLSSVTRKLRRFLEVIDFCIRTRGTKVPHAPDWRRENIYVDRIAQGAGRAVASVRLANGHQYHF
jgi:hypothetical protein